MLYLTTLRDIYGIEMYMYHDILGKNIKRFYYLESEAPITIHKCLLMSENETVSGTPLNPRE
jgi:hypothetical protein